jgi:hypothetical protein
LPPLRSFNGTGFFGSLGIVSSKSVFFLGFHVGR